MAKMAVSGPSGIATVQHQLKFLISIMSAKKKKSTKTKQRNKEENKTKTNKKIYLGHLFIFLYFIREAFNTFV